MKKNTKPTKTPAPATKITAPAPKPAASKPAAPTKALKSTIEPKIKKADAPAPAAVVTKPKHTRVTIIANVDVGFGNTLYIRGDEPALDWKKGVALGCVHDNKWEIVLSGPDKAFEFKFLVNDSTWSSGENFCASPADTLTLSPSF